MNKSYPSVESKKLVLSSEEHTAYIERLKPYLAAVFEEKGVLSDDQLKALDSIVDELSSRYTTQSFREVYGEIQGIREMDGVRKQRIYEEGLEAEASRLDEQYDSADPDERRELASRINAINRELYPYHFHGVTSPSDH